MMRRCRLDTRPWGATEQSLGGPSVPHSTPGTAAQASLSQKGSQVLVVRGSESCDPFLSCPSATQKGMEWQRGRTKEDGCGEGTSPTGLTDRPQFMRPLVCALHSAGTNSAWSMAQSLSTGGFPWSLPRVSVGERGMTRKSDAGRQGQAKEF